VLRGINLEIEDGEFLTIFGANGAGKTTLVKIIATLLSPTYGSVTVDGFDTKASPIDVRKRIGVISHETYLYHELTARENLLFYGRMYGVGGLQERVSGVMELVGLEARANDRVGTFSRGMKQRLSIARAILHDPPILLLDEPYTGLDQRAAETFDRVLESAGASGKTRVMVSHDMEKGLACDRAVIISRGEIAHQCSRDEIRDLAHFRAMYAQYVVD